VKTKVATIIAAMLVVWCLKRHYAGASVEDLRWMLTPTADAAGILTGTTYTFLPGEGYFSREWMFLIEKSCAGINFMIAAFAMLVMALRRRAVAVRSAALLLAVSLLASYSAAVFVNAVRIAIAMWLAVHPAVLSAFNAADVHRLEGIAVYFGGLVLLYDLAQRLDGHVFPRGRRA
jgi:exosortase K